MTAPASNDPPPPDADDADDAAATGTGRGDDGIASSPAMPPRAMTASYGAPDGARTEAGPPSAALAEYIDRFDADDDGSAGGYDGGSVDDDSKAAAPFDRMAEHAGAASGGPVDDGEEALVPLGEVLLAIDRERQQAAQQTAAEVLRRTRTPPHALDAERAVLGALLLEPSAYERVVDEGLRPEHFYRPHHGTVFRAIAELHAAAEPIDTLTVVDELLRRGQLDAVGGAAAISALEALLPTAAHVGSYARLVREKAVLRQLIESATSVVQSSYAQNMRVEDILDEAERSILAISQGTTKKSIVPMRELVRRATEQLEKAHNNRSPITGLATGFRKLDYMTSGLQPGDLIIVAARPSMGKTAFTLNVAGNVATRLQKPVMFFSLEMGAEQLVQRLMGAEARIDISNLRRGFIERSDWSRLAEASGRLSEAPLFIDETPSISVTEMRNKCRRQLHETGLSLIMVDYLQLMQGPSGYDNKATEVGEISKGLKTLARELGVPVVALSQLNRSVEARNDKRPMMSDLRESGAIEQDADIIMFLYREEYYLKEKTPEDRLGIAELIIAKHRNGATGTVDLRFFNSITRFEDLDRETHDYAP
jgi:replicative DNA helicase